MPWEPVSTSDAGHIMRDHFFTLENIPAVDMLLHAFRQGLQGQVATGIAQGGESAVQPMSLGSGHGVRRETSSSTNRVDDSGVYRRIMEMEHMLGDKYPENNCPKASEHIPIIMTLSSLTR